MKDDTLAKRLRRLRLQAGFPTQQALADATKRYRPPNGIGRSMINKIESGARTNPSLETLVIIAQTLGCLIDDLVPTGTLVAVLREDPEAYEVSRTIMLRRIKAKVDDIEDPNTLQHLLDYIGFIKSKEG